MEKQLHLFFNGHVQGVGFRFTAESIANNLNITGWVKNLADGRVEIVARGEEDALKNYLEQIKRSFRNYIDDIDIQYQSVSGNFKDFRLNKS